MKRIILSVMALLAISFQLSAQVLSVADVEAVPGETVAFALDVDVEGGAYSGFQFQMKFPATGFTTTGTTVSSAWDGGTFAVGDLDGGIANGAALSLSDTPIPDGNLEIGTVRFTVGDNLAVGDYKVTISNFDFLDGTNYTHVPDVSFYVHVVTAHLVTLDETSVSEPGAAQGVNARVLRTINAGEWSTICLPFDMTESQVKAAFGSDVQLADFNDYEYDEERDALTVKFQLATAIEANHPYVIKVGSPVAEFTVEGVDIDPQEAVVDFDTSRRKNQPRQFVGTYVANTLLEWGTLFLSGNQFWYSVGETKMKGYRAYFNFNDVLADFESNYASRISMSFFDEDVTGITEHCPDGLSDDACYDLQGRRLQKPGKGLYIKNGTLNVKR